MRGGTRVITVVGLVLSMATMASAGQVWESTFDTDADGVVDLRTDNNDGDSEVMIGPNVGGVQLITTEAQDSTESNKAGRPTGSTLTTNDSFSALYTFDWTFEAVDPGVVPEFFAGFTCDSQTHSTRSMMGARFKRETLASGAHYVQIAGAFGSWGSTNGSYNWSPNTEMGTDLEGRALQLAIGYDGATKVLDVGLFDGTDGSELIRVTGDIRNYFGPPWEDPNHADIAAELSNWTDDYAVGWTDFIAGVDDIDTTWNMDSLRYYNDATSAFGDVVPEPATGLMLMLCGLVGCLKRPRR